MAISGAPPPATTLPSSNVAATTPIASSTALSTSSATCLVLPLSMIETALGSTQSSTNNNISSKIFFSYTCPAIPRSSGWRSSRLVATLAPVAFSNLSISDFLTLLTASIPSLAR